MSVTSGSISRLLTTSGTGQMRLQIDCVIRHGNSGGPLVNEDGQVLGIAVSSVSDEEDSSMYYGVNIDEVIPYLKQYDVPYVLQEAGATQSSSETSLAEGTAPAGDTIVVPESTEEDPKESSGGVPAAVWVVIGVAVAAVAGVVIFLLLQKGKKTPAKSSLYNRRPLRRLPLRKCLCCALWPSSTTACESQSRAGRSSLAPARETARWCSGQAHQVSAAATAPFLGMPLPGISF